MVFNFLLILFTLLLYLIINNIHVEKEKRKIYFLRIIFIVFFILVAFREMTIGNDTQMYLNLFKKCSVHKWSMVKTGGYFEVGYLALNTIISYISNNPRFFMVIMSGIFNYCSYKFIKDNSNNYLFSCIMYICLLFIYTSMTMMRQFTALSILLLGTKYAKEKKLIKFFLIVLLASLFHSSAYVALLYYLIYNMKYTKNKVFIIVIIGIIASVNIGSFFDYIANFIGRVNYYSDRVDSNSVSNVIYTIIYFLMYLFALYEINKSNNNAGDKRKKDFYLLSLLFAAIINMLGIKMNIMSRVALYFDVLTIVSLPNIIHDNVYNIDNRKKINIAFLLVFTLYSSTIIYYKPNWNSAYNYKSCLFPHDDYICSYNNEYIF